MAERRSRRGRAEDEPRSSVVQQLQELVKWKREVELNQLLKEYRELSQLEAWVHSMESARYEFPSPLSVSPNSDLERRVEALERQERGGFGPAVEPEALRHLRFPKEVRQRRKEELERELVENGLLRYEYHRTGPLWTAIPIAFAVYLVASIVLLLLLVALQGIFGVSGIFGDIRCRWDSSHCGSPVLQGLVLLTPVAPAALAFRHELSKGPSTHRRIAFNSGADRGPA